MVAKADTKAEAERKGKDSKVNYFIEENVGSVKTWVLWIRW